LVDAGKWWGGEEVPRFNKLFSQQYGRRAFFYQLSAFLPVLDDID